MEFLTNEESVKGVSTQDVRAHLDELVRSCPLALGTTVEACCMKCDEDRRNYREFCAVQVDGPKQNELCQRSEGRNFRLVGYGLSIEPTTMFDWHRGCS